MTKSFFVSLNDGMSIATKAADDFGLPQTLYKNADTCGWANTNPFSKILHNKDTKQHCSVLPKNYFL
jgi:hypothetical protein